MKLTTFITLLSSSIAVATAQSSVVTASNAAPTLDPVEHFITTSNDTVQSLIHLGCKFKSCLEALAPTIAACALALAQEEFGQYYGLFWAMKILTWTEQTSSTMPCASLQLQRNFTRSQRSATVAIRDASIWRTAISRARWS